MYIPIQIQKKHKTLASLGKLFYNIFHEYSVEEATVLELYREPVGGVNRRTKEPFHFGAVSEELKGGNLYLTI